MKAKHLFLVLVGLAALVAAGVYPVLKTAWFSQTFAKLTEGASFTGKEGGTTGGTWGTIGTGVATVATSVGRKCLSIDTSQLDDGAIHFTASQGGPKTVNRVDFAIGMQPIDWFPSVSTNDDRCALFYMADEDGLQKFGAYVGEWVTLYGHGFVRQSEQWLDCRADLETDHVTFYMRVDSGAYLPLVDESGNSRLAITNKGSAKTLAFRGQGYLGDFEGAGIEQDSTRVRTWNWQSSSGETKSWDVAKNWTPQSVPGDGDLASIGSGNDIIYGKYTLHTYAATQLSIVKGESLYILTGDLEITCDDDDYASLGTVIVDAGATLRASGTYDSLEMAVASKLVLTDGTLLIVGDEPFCFDRVNLDVPASTTTSDTEAMEAITAPYGSGGTPLSLTRDGGSSAGWTAVWYGKLDGSVTLWLVNGNFKCETAVWNEGVRGNLVTEANWGDTKPSSTRAARINGGKAHVNDGDTFQFQRRLDIGAGASEEGGELAMSGGTIVGNISDGSAIVVGAEDGTGTFDVGGGTVVAYDHLWTYALTVGADMNATGVVSLRGGKFDAKDGSISIGAAGSAYASLVSSPVVVGGDVAIGYEGTFDVSGGSLAVGKSVYVGRATRGEAYDAAMNVSGGVITNTGDGVFMVGSYGGTGSKAVLTVSGGEIDAVNGLIVGGRRSGSAVVSGGRIVTPQIRLADAFQDAADVASFLISGGRVETAGFSVGTNGSAAVTISGGEIVAVTTNEDFFAGLDCARLDGDVVFDNESNVTIRTALAGVGGITKNGAGTLKIAGYAAWNGPIAVEQGVLDMDGGMVMGELEVAEGAEVINKKYDDLDSLTFSDVTWNNNTQSTRSYVRIAFTMAEGETGVAKVEDADGVLQGAVRRSADGLEGWTAIGWQTLLRTDGSAVGTADCDVRMFFDFRPGTKPYVIYEIADGDGAFSRLISSDGIEIFPVAGALNVKKFSGVTMTEGLEMLIASGSAYYWIGPEDGNWNDGANWSFTEGGAAANKCPTADATAFVGKSVTIHVGEGSVASSLMLNAKVRIAGSSLTVANLVSGSGQLVLAGASLVANLAGVSVRVPVEIDAETDNEIFGPVTLCSALEGLGTLATSARFRGDASDFAGNVTLSDGAFETVEALDNTYSSWTLAKGFPFALDGQEYVFGSLNGTIEAGAGDSKSVTLTVGAKDEACSLAGGWPVLSESVLKWTASAQLNSTVTNLGALVISGGGDVVVGTDVGFPSKLSFVGKGGCLKFAEGVDVDLSSALSNSTAAICFDDGGVDRTWAAPIAASNVGGFVKRGSGTLTWLAAPQGILNVTIEDGTLVVPFGTRFNDVHIGLDKRLVLDMGGSPESGVALSVVSSNRRLSTPPYLEIVNAPEEYEIQTAENNGIAIFIGNDSFVWAGGEAGKWNVLKNWKVDGEQATRLPADQDSVEFREAALVTLADDVHVRTLTGTSDLGFIGDELTFNVDGAFDLSSGTLQLRQGVAVSSATLSVGSLTGTGTVNVASGKLDIAPSESATVSEFVGTINVTNFVKGGLGDFIYHPQQPFGGVLSVAKGRFLWNCADAVTNQSSATLTMSAGCTLDLCGKTILVDSFTGAGIVTNGLLVTVDGLITQKGGDLVVPAVHNTTYVLSRAGERLWIVDAAGLGTEIIVPREWFTAGASGHNAVFCECSDIIWNVQRRNAKRPTSEGNGWWSIPGSGFTIRLR